MICEHLRHLYQLCLDQKIRLGGSDLIHLFCQQCGHKEICPSMLLDDSAEEADSDQPGAEAVKKTTPGDL